MRAHVIHSLGVMAALVGAMCSLPNLAKAADTSTNCTPKEFETAAVSVARWLGEFEKSGKQYQDLIATGDDRQKLFKDAEEALSKLLPSPEVTAVLAEIQSRVSKEEKTLESLKDLKKQMDEETRDLVQQLPALLEQSGQRKTVAGEQICQFQTEILAKIDAGFQSAQRKMLSILEKAKSFKEEAKSLSDAQFSSTTCPEKPRSELEAVCASKVLPLSDVTLDAEAAATLRALEEALKVSGNATLTSAASPGPMPKDAVFRRTNGDEIRYGIATSVMRYHVLRDPNEPGRQRSYDGHLDTLSGDIGFQVTYAPNRKGLHWYSANGQGLQIVSFGGLLLTQLHPSDPKAETSLSLLGLLGFLDDTIGVGLGFDLYRAVPIKGAEGRAVAQTGLLAWATSSTGEVTPENMLFVITLNASGVAAALFSKQGEK